MEELELTRATTEQRNPRSMGLDRMSSLEIAKLMNDEDKGVALAVEKVLPEVAKAIDWAREALGKGGRLIYIGAGTSGRLGVLDAAECPPTFGVEPGVVVGLIAGGDRALTTSVEGAEDDPVLCEEDLRSLGLNSKDLVVGLAASGRTPYVLGGFAYAKKVGCRTVAISCNSESAVGREAGLSIEPVTGPEVLTGSTRLKAGTAEKMVLNMISTGSMVGLGKAYENLMVDVQQSNHKLTSRAVNIVCEATGCSTESAREALDRSLQDVKVAVVMLLAGISVEEARGRLESSSGHVREALEQRSSE